MSLIVSICQKVLFIDLSITEFLKIELDGRIK